MYGCCGLGDVHLGIYAPRLNLLCSIDTYLDHRYLDDAVYGSVYARRFEVEEYNRTLKL